MMKRRWAYRPAYMPTQVPSVQPESRRDRFISAFSHSPAYAVDAWSDLGVPCRVWVAHLLAYGFWVAIKVTSLAISPGRGATSPR